MDQNKISKQRQLGLHQRQVASFQTLFSLILYEVPKISVIQSDIRALPRIDYREPMSRHFQPASVWNRCHFGQISGTISKMVQNDKASLILVFFFI